MTRPARTISSRDFNQSTGAAKKAARNGPVYITDRGQTSHVLLSYEHYRELADNKPSIVDILCATPGIGDIDFEIPRLRDVARPAVFD
ncbi:MAG: type II toxin-antitoxin system Phd/YefM family antitoxin [Acidimicrobiia bacterium]|nr:type II toxin-antitoxin system Phd/YefM family antitoxin [Acidimicrobiia bacterium]MYH06398.1 type II toxin-antitoxin system Phd/YefM family antitoxin [Acidimicrobiia bacterium]